jgi:hypothetical protein
MSPDLPNSMLRMAKSNGFFHNRRDRRHRSHRFILISDHSDCSTIQCYNFEMFATIDASHLINHIILIAAAVMVVRT